MTPSLQVLMETGRLPPLAYYFARFIAGGCGAGEDSVLALSAALVSARGLDGDVCVELPTQAGRVLFAEDARTDAGGPVAPALADWLTALRACTWVGAPGARAPLILDGERLYLGKYWHFEARVAAALLARLTPLVDLDAVRLADGLARLFPAPGGSTDDSAEPDWQRIAAAIAVTRRFAVISGGPGTGKTTTVVKVLALLLEQDSDLRIALAAPTGKAAARLSESIGTGKAGIAAAGSLAQGILARIPEQAQTIHRLLGYGAGGPFRNDFRRDADNLLPLDCLVVDEASMIDLPLMARLLAALPGSARLVLLGDRDQLASVEAGNVLGDITGRGQPIRYVAEQTRLLLRAGAVPAAVLAESPGAEPRSSASDPAGSGPAMSDPEVPDPAAGDDPPPIAAAVALLRVSWRFGAGSGIGALARAVNAGDGAAALDLLDGAAHPDITRLEPTADAPSPACIDWALARFAPVLDADDPEAALEQLERARVLAALHRGPFGVEALNARITERLRAGHRLASPGGGDGLYHGMPIMVTANDYEVDLYNGDVGLLWSDRASDLGSDRGPDGARRGGCREDGQRQGGRGDTAGRLRAHFRAAAGGLRSLSVRQLPPHVCAYALTVHKSQGSELDDLLLVLPPEPHPLATRELLYTAVTRARKRVTVHAGSAALLQACASRVQRTSGLAERLGWPPSP